MLTGSCLCGDIAFEVHGEISRMMHCHCSMCRSSRCRRRMSAAYGTAFCGTCGSLVPRERDPGAMQVPAGALDTDPGCRPGANIFTGSKAPWTTLDESIACFEEYPAPA